MCILQIRLLGGLEVTAGTAPINLTYDKVRALLAYLVVEADRAHHRADLAALLWPDRPERLARQSLSQALYSLRRALATAVPDATFLTADAQRVRWHDAAPYCVDIDHLHRAQASWHAPPDDDTLATLEAAATAYTGEFLAGFALRDAAEFEAWVTVRREHFHQLALETLRQLADRHEQQRAFATALDYARQRLALDSWQEDAQRQVMRMLDALGQPDAALAQYRECRAVLAAELGVEPSAATELLHRQIVAHRRTAQPPPLPILLTPLFGRERELAQITTRLTAPDCRFLSLVGPGGSGKSHLALAAAHDLRGAFGDGVAFIGLAGLTAPTEILPAVAQELGLHPAKGEDVAQQVEEYLRPRAMLLVLDNMEHLAAGVPQLTRLLQCASGIKILATTRAVLHAAGEHVIRLGGLALDDTTDTQDVPPATALFLYHMRRRRPAFAPTAAELQTITAICRQVGGMPLAILLAAALTTTTSLADLAHALAGRSDTPTLDLLAADWPDLPPRQRSMRAVWTHAWEQLDAATQAGFAALSVFHDGFTLDAARAVVGTDLPSLRTLTDWSLVAPVGDRRFALHELLRQYAAERLAGQGRTNAIQARHAHYFATLCADQGAALCSAQQLTALADLTTDLANILAAWRHAVAQREAHIVATMTDGLCRYLEWRGRSAQGVDLCELALAHVQDASVRPRLIIWKALFLDCIGHPATARADLNALLNPHLCAGAQPLSDDDRAFALHMLGKLNIGVETTAAHALLSESLRIYRARHAQWDTAATLVALADLHVLTADYAAALALADEAAHIAWACGDRRVAANAMRVKSGCYGMQGHLQQAEDAARSSIDMLRALDDRRGVAETLMELASKFVYAGEFAHAIRLWDEMEAFAQTLGAWRLQAAADHFRGWGHTNLGRYVLAEEYYLRADRLYCEGEDRHMLALGALGRGELRLALGDFTTAYALLMQAADGLAAVGQEDEAALARGELVLALRGLGREDEAWAQLTEMLGALQPTNAFPPLQNAVNAYALLLCDVGEIERAVELHALAAQHPYIAQSVYRYDVIGRTLAEQAATLAPAQRAALEARGRRRNLWATVAELREQSTQEVRLLAEV